MAEPFLDTNVFLRHLRQDDPIFSPKASAIIGRIEQGDLQVRISETVIFEAVFTLERFYKTPSRDVAQQMLDLIRLPGIILPGKTIYERAFEVYLETRLGFADAYHVALMERLGLDEILSFDTDFDRVPGIKRREA